MHYQMRASKAGHEVISKAFSQGTWPRATRHFSTTSTFHANVDLPTLDEKWQRKWAETRSLRREAPNAKKAYILPMFPYPSGSLHIGHLRVYTIADVLARFHRMQGKKVLFPMGWDAFGLPAENAAIERGIHPKEWTEDNVEKMKNQLDKMNGDFDWSREFKTCDPNFYKHTQRLFLHLHEHGLAYQDEAIVNYDPIDKTVLANEQVDADGRSWRSGAKVEKKSLRQWFFRITSFRDELLQGLDTLQKAKGWPERVLTMQRNWLGKSEGAVIKFEIQTTSKFPLVQKYVSVFTTRADTLFGVQFLALSLTHPIVQGVAARDSELQRFIDGSDSKSVDSKAGYPLKDVFVLNPLSSTGTNDAVPDFVSEPLPVYAAPYVLDSYGEGAVMGVPGHDDRDHAFWQQHQGTKAIRNVIKPNKKDDERNYIIATLDGKPFLPPGNLSQSCGDYRYLSSEEAAARIVNNLESIGLAKETAMWRLRDWLISRQRYWGTPIPIVHCESCGAVPVPISELPVTLPELEALPKAGNPLDSAAEWVNTKCPKCQGPAKRETDTMDTFVDSSWYFMRFPDAQNDDELFSPQSAESMLPVDIYIGGVEHAILHLLYARFITKFVRSIGLWPAGGESKNLAEPFERLITQGMVHGKTYSERETGRFLRPNELDLSNPSSPELKGLQTEGIRKTPKVSWEKMSKSKHNGVDATSALDKYGADALRAHMLFQAPITEVLRWDEERIVGIQRWLGKLFTLVENLAPRLPSQSKLQPGTGPILSLSPLVTSNEVDLHVLLNSITASITKSFSTTYSLNTAISDLIKLTNATIAQGLSNVELAYHSTRTLLRLLAPVAPAFAEECWSRLHPHQTESGLNRSIFDEPFPTVERLPPPVAQSRKCTVQENGKLRFVIWIPAVPEGWALKTPQAEVKDWVLKEIAKTKRGKLWFAKNGGREWKKIICVKDLKHVNFVG